MQLFANCCYFVSYSLLPLFRIIFHRKSKSPTPPSGGGGFGGVFANVDLTKFGGSKPPTAAPVPASTPGFVVPLHSGLPAQAKELELTEEKKSKLSTLTKKFLEHCRNLGDRTYDPIGTERFLVTYLSIKNPRSEAPAPAAPASNPAPLAPAQSVPAPAPAPASNLFSGSTASAAPAPATSNLFGTSPGQKPAITFGGTNTLAPVAPAPAPVTGLVPGGAQFGGSPVAAAPSPSAWSMFPPSATKNNDDNNKTEPSTAAFGGFSTAPSPAVAAAVAAPASNGEDDNAQEDDGGTETAARNPDANVEAQFECDGKVFQVVEKNGKSDRENLGVGRLKLERNAQTGKSQLVIVSFSLRIV